jgi:hypothetical protein
MKFNLLFLLITIFHFQTYAGGTLKANKNTMFNIITFTINNKPISSTFIKDAKMIIILTSNKLHEIVYMENRWLNFNSYSVGSMQAQYTATNKLTTNHYIWKPINSYDNKKNTCNVTTYEVKKDNKVFRYFTIDVSNGSRLQIVAQKIEFTSKLK